MAPHSSTLAWKIPWREEASRLQSVESNTAEWLHFHISLPCIGKGNGNPLQCSCLENLRDGGAWWAAVYGVAQSRTQLKRLSSSTPTLKKKTLKERGSLRPPKERQEEVIIERKEGMSSAKCPNPAEMFHNNRDWENTHWIWQLDDVTVNPNKSHINGMIVVNLYNSVLRSELVKVARGCKWK